MNRLALLPHALFKGRQLARRWLDEREGWRRAAHRAEAWARSWEAGGASLDAWLSRSGAGRLWLEPAAGARWARRTTREEDVAFAEAVLTGLVPRLGADPRVGHPPAWRRDGYTGREWPLLPASRHPLHRGDGSDIRTVWELSRGYHLVLLARAWWRTADPRFLEGLQSHVESWLADNPPGLGPNWISPMDAAIRGANWALAAVLLARAPGISAEFWARLLANLRLTAWYVARYPEWHPIHRGNHYISNGVGLVYLGALFRDDPEGARWLRRGAGILCREMFHQVHSDGVSFEGSVAYHRLVTEFFTFGGEVVRRNLPAALPPKWWERLERMHQFLDLCLDAGGKAPLIGDADDGRLHWLCAAAATDPRRHRLGIPRRGRAGPLTSAAFPMGGFYVLRGGRDRAVVRCGPVGLAGAGSHDHNDQLGFELSLDGQDFITDSGTYCYTRDLATRFAFRATAAHSVIQLGGEEQNPIAVDRPWRVLAERTRSECLAWEAGPGGARFTGRHSGYAHRLSRAVCQRMIRLHEASGIWEIDDLIEGQGREIVAWRLHLSPGPVTLLPRTATRWSLDHPALAGRSMELELPEGLAPRLGQSLWSERYGVLVSRTVLEASGDVALPARIGARIAPTTPESPA
jgi:hypothetical protein